MRFRDRPRSIWELPLGVLAIVLIVLAGDTGGVATKLRLFLFDTYQRTSPRPYQETSAASGYAVRVLEIDGPSLVRFGSWPWPRGVLARLTGEMKAQGARIVVFAFPLDRPDPLSPRNLMAQIAPGPSADAVRSALEKMSSPDDALAAAMKSVKTVSGFSLGSFGIGHRLPVTCFVGYAGSSNPFAATPQFESAAAPIIPLAAASAGVGAINLVPDSDGVLRRVPLVMRLRGRPVASLEADVSRVAAHQSAVTLQGGYTFPIGTPVVSSWNALGRDLPTTADGSLWIAYARESAERNLSPVALDEGKLAGRRLKNAIVYIGAPDDIVATPLGPRTAASVHAEAMENILLGTPLVRPQAARLVELAALVLLGLGMILILVRLGVAWAGGFTLLAIAGAAGMSWYLYAADRILSDALGPGLGLALVFMSGAAASLYEIIVSRSRVRKIFAETLSPETSNQIARLQEPLKLDGEKRVVSYLACGIRGFAALAQSFDDDPVAFLHLLERVFGPLMDEVLNLRGTIEVATHEGVTCFWNAPLDDAEHAIHACEAANRMTAAVARVNDVITLEHHANGTAVAPVEIGIGISTGPAIVGGFRSPGRTTYFAHGDCAVLAARTQALSGLYGPAVIISEDTRKAAERGFAFLEVDALETAGGPVKLFAVLGNSALRASPKFRALTTFHDHIFQSLRAHQWVKARKLIEQCRKLSGASQRLYDLHLARIAEIEAHPTNPERDDAAGPQQVTP